MEPLTIILIMVGLMAFVAIKIYFGKRFLASMKDKQKPTSQQLD
jgi:hypothetical protein